VFGLNGSNDVYLYEDRNTGTKVIGNLLSYQGIWLNPNVVKDLYFRILKEQRAASGERHPEFDVVGIFREIVKQHATDFTHDLLNKKLEQLPRLLAEAHRATSLFRLQLIPGVDDTLRQLHPNYHLAVVTDGQSAYAVPELNAVGLSGCFDPIIVSGDFGYRKPARRLFKAALGAMKMEASEVLFVGNDMYRDVYGAQKAGMKAVFFKSNQGTQEKAGVKPDYSIFRFPELLNAVRFFEDQ
jgi:putative hydrolase of the HAD superfamily